MDFDQVEMEETRELLRYAARKLTARQRIAVLLFLGGEVNDPQGKKFSKSRLQGSREEAFHKMRVQLRRLGIRSVSDLLTCEPRGMNHL